MAHEPDCFDLNDWVLTTQPELYKATKYLPPAAQFQLWDKVWRDAGQPVIWEVIA